MDIRTKLGIVSELGSFLKNRKRWWLLPVIIFLIALSAFIVFTEGSALAPLIYALF